MTKNRVDKFIKNPKKSLFILAFPIVIAMLVQVLYNIVDTAFVGRLGAEAIAALTFALPIFFILMALNHGVGIGMASRISRFLGEKKKKQAENTAIHGVLISIGLAVVIFLAGFFVLNPLFRLLGAEGIVLTYAVDYMSIILIGVFFMFPSFVLVSMFMAQGDTKTPMKIQISALILNIILDPIFIYVLNMGVKGAAIATSISFVFSFLLSLYYIKKKSYLCIAKKCFNYSNKITKEIFSVGMPTTLVMVLVSVYVMFINNFASSFGVEYVAVIGLTFRLDSLAFLPIVALSSALMTLVGMFYGAKRYNLLKSIIYYAMKIGTLFTLAITVIFFLFPQIFLRIFTDDPTLLSLGASYMRVYVWTFPLLIFSMISVRSLQAMGKGLPGLIINAMRVLVVATPLAYIFVFVMGKGFLSIALAMVLGNLIGAIVATIILGVYFKKFGILKKKQKPVAE